MNCASKNNEFFRAKRDTNEAFKVQIDVPVKRENILDPETNQKYEIIDLIQSEVLLKDLFNLEQVGR